METFFYNAHDGQIFETLYTLLILLIIDNNYLYDIREEYFIFLEQNNVEQ